MKKSLQIALCIISVTIFAAAHGHAQEGQQHLEVKPHDRIVLIGNTFFERMQDAGYFETLLHSRFPEKELVVRNLGWSADELTLRPRSKDFQDHGHNLEDHKADVIIACFGFNESFAGKSGIPKFEADLKKFIDTTLQAKYNGKSHPQLVLFSPIANEDLKRHGLTDCKENNQRIKLYTDSMQKMAKEKNVLFIDLFTPSKKLMKSGDQDFTFNGIHLTDYGYQQLAPIIDEALFGTNNKTGSTVDMKKLRAEVLEKNRQFWYDYRAVNGYYIYGGRKKPFGVVNFPAEFAKLRKMIENRDKRIWAVAQGKTVPHKIDDSQTGEFADIKTNVKDPSSIRITSPQESQKKFELPEGFEINLFASEVDFPELKNPVQFTFDSQGRLWVCTMESYPQYLPGKDVDDKVLIFEDTNGDGRADKQTIFADGLHLPTGIELGDGGAYVAQQPNLVFLKDTDGDGYADHKEIVLHGFDSADSHHAISAFTWGPGGDLYFQEGTFHHTQVETPYGPRRVKNAGVFRYEPRTEKFDIFISYSYANPWGHVFDRWGQNFVADASGGANYFGTAYSGDLDYPRKHAGMKHFLKKQWRPTAGCEFVSSRQFPEEMQGNYLLNNCIGFHGVLQYKMKEDGSGFAADPVEPLVKSTDTNFRPVDLQFGPDGALYLIDWFNPLVGHMQHSIRDPNRDAQHGRIWRVTYSKKPLLKDPEIAKASIPELLDLLKTYEDRVRYRVRRELRIRDTQEVTSAVNKWVATLDPKDKDYQHHLLEALWVHQNLDVVDVQFLKKMLRSPEPRARAAATRVLCYWRDRVNGSLELLRAQVNDEHPRVRLEAIRALSFYHDPQALDIAVESLIHPQDYYLEYTLKETMDTLEKRMSNK
ncbi:PVC-type heme-binding CxxCH protein [Gimesia aquarii]|uniref:Membrane bound L-sorbosone dehydrogenase n=1 Tax=Gimesia aquarii TaxID=2527964 RepID=A0A517WZA1_9PLAN|nr:PVC-type heme-binding CxxCH protein [Gimesia aquarii]QDU10580.1 Membrane bound L-sorbosone dehydrogenase [Gimesia aquarii]